VKFTLDDAANIAMGAAVAVGGAKLGLGAVRVFSGRRKGPPGKGAPGAPGGDAFISPVFVTNWPAGFGAGAGASGEPGGRGRPGGRAGARFPGGVAGLLALLSGAMIGGVQEGDEAMAAEIEARLAGARGGAGGGVPATGFRGLMDRDRRAETEARRDFVLRRQAGLAERAAAGGFGGEGARDPRVDALIEATRDVADEVAASGRRAETILRAIATQLRDRRPAFGPDPRTGRMMVGPQ